MTRRKSEYAKQRLQYMRDYRKAEIVRERIAKAAAKRLLMQHGRVTLRRAPLSDTARGVDWAHAPTRAPASRQTLFHRENCPTCGPETLHKTGKCCHCGTVIPRKTWLTVDQWVRSKGGKQRAVREV